MAISYDNTNYDLQSQLDLLNVHAITNKGSAYANGLYKITTNAEGHVISATSVVKSDITALGIPAQDTVYSLPKMTSSALGGAKVGYTSSGKNYGVQIDSDGNLYVNVPWTDNNTTYSAGTGLSLSSTTFSLATVSGLTAGSYGPSVNQTPAYGATFTVPYLTVDSYGRVTAISDKTVKISDGVATTSTAGLMSASDKTKLDGIATGATANVVSDSLSDTSTTNALSAAKGKTLNDYFNLDLMEDEIRKIANVSDAKVIINRTSETVDGIPAHTIAAYVYNGNAGYIAQKIYDYNTIGYATTGSVSRTVSSGDTVYFNRPTNRFCIVHVILEGLTAPSIDSVSTAIKNVVMTYINGLRIGATLNTIDLKDVVLDAAESLSIGTFNIQDINITTTSETEKRGIITGDAITKWIVNDVSNVSVSAVQSAAGSAISALNSKIAKAVNNKKDFVFPGYASDVHDGNNEYIVQHNGIAVFTIIFDNNNYSQIAIMLNNNYLTAENQMISSNGVSLENHIRYLTIPVFAGDVIKSGYYSTYGVKALKMRLLYGS